jgi:biopolymer transport protein ExbD
MSFSMAGGGARGPQINITPLIDVLLTLIFVFMVVVSMDEEQGETAQIPQPDQKQTQKAPQTNTIVIQIVWAKGDQRPTVKINREQCELGRSGNAARGNLLEALGKSSLRARRQ